MRKMMLFVSVVMALSVVFGAVQIQPGTTTVVTDATLGGYAAGIEFVAATEEQTPGVVEFDTTAAPMMALVGKGVVKKTSTSSWTLTVAQTGFTGDFVIEKGVVTCTKAVQCGGIAAGTGAVYVRSGAALNLNITTGTADDKFTARAIHLAGTGCGGYRALHVTKAPSGAISLLHLDDDATVYVVNNSNHYWFSSEGSPRFGDWRGHLYSGGHTLSKYGAMLWPFLGVDVHGGGRIVVCEGQSQIRDAKWPLEEGETHQPFELTDGTTLMFWNRPQPVPRPLQVDGKATLRYTVNNNDPTLLTTNFANWAGPVQLVNSSSALTVNPNNSDWRHQLTISGPIDGPGSLIVGATSVDGGRGRVALAGTNTYTGTTTVYGGSDNVLDLYRPESVPDLAKLTACDGHVSARVLSEDATEGWTKTVIWNWLNVVDFGRTGGFHLTATDCADATYTLPLADVKANVTNPMAPIGSAGGTLLLTAESDAELDMPRLNVIGGTTVLDGAAKLMLTGTNYVGGPCLAMTNAPALVLQGGVEVWQGDAPFLVGAQKDLNAGHRHRGRLVVSNASWRAVDVKAPSGDSAGQWLNALVLGSHHGAAQLEIVDGGLVSNKVICGLSGYPNGGNGSGAIYVERGGTFSPVLRGSGHLTSVLGMSGSGYGYLQLADGGRITGQQMIGIGGYGRGVCHLYGGEVDITGGIEVENCNNGLATFYITNATIQLKRDQYLRAGNGNASHATIVLDGPEAGILGTAGTYANQSSESRVVFSLVNGGRIRTYYFVEYQKNGTTKYEHPLVVALDGGVVEVYYDSSLFGADPAKTPKVVVGAAGGTIDTLAGKSYTQYANVPLSSETSNGILSVNLPGGEVSGLVGAPHVWVSAGGGSGAALVADWDPVRRVLKGVKVCSPGWGYDPATVKVTISCGADWSKTLTAEDIAVGATETGGMTFKGTGPVVLNATNEWEKWTCLEGGVKVKVVHERSMKSGTELRLKDGTLDLNNLGDAAPTFSSLSGTGGTVQNGAVRLVGTDGTVNISAKQFLSGAPCSLKGTLDLSSVTRISLTDTELLTEEAWQTMRARNLITATEIVNWENVEIAGVPDNWRAVKTSNGLRLGPVRGSVLILR